MKEWLLANKKTIGLIALLFALYVLSKFPALQAESELLGYIWSMIAMGSVGFVPAFTRKGGDK